MMERAHISWQEDSAYDEWDAIAEALYKAIVASTVQEGRGLRDCRPLPRYAHRHRDYSKFSLIRVYGGIGNGVLFSLTSLQEPFDAVRCMRVTETGEADEPNIVMPLDDADFALEARYADGRSPTLTREVEVLL
jgi:hypothetical protein